MKSLPYQTVPVEFLLHILKENKVAAGRDYLYFREKSKWTCGYFKAADHRDYINSSTLGRLLKEGWITRHSRGHYKITSVFDIFKSYGFTDRKTVRDIHLSDILGPASRFRAYIIARLESYVGRRKYKAIRYMERKKLLPEKPIPNELTSFLIARDTILREKGTLVKLSCRYMAAITGLDHSTISRLRKEYNGEFNSYRRDYCDFFDSKGFTRKEDVHKHVIQLANMEEISGGNPYRHMNIVFDKSRGIYRKVVSTVVKSRSNGTMGVLHKKHLGDFQEPQKYNKYVSYDS